MAARVRIRRANALRVWERPGAGLEACVRTCDQPRTRSMGLAFSGLWQRMFGKEERRILMVGLNGAGKTTILYKLKLGEIVTTIPTIGSAQRACHQRNSRNLELYIFGNIGHISQIFSTFSTSFHDGSDRTRTKYLIKQRCLPTLRLYSCTSS